MPTNLQTALSIIFLILTPAIIMPVYGQTKQNTTESGGQQQMSQSQNSLTMNDVRQSRLVLLQGIDNAILRLVQSEFNTTHIAQLSKTDQLCVTVAELKKLQAHLIEAFGQEAANKQVVPRIQNLITALEKQQSSATTCG